MVRLRLVLKGMLLACASRNPFYLASVSILTDALLLGVEYCLRSKSLICPKNWLMSNILCLTSLGIYFFLPDSVLSLALPTVFVVIVIFS
jgi:hypothetical protein